MRGGGGGVCRPNQTETAADAFLNWVRTQFDASAKGQAWLNFFEDANQRIGMFLRNAVIRQIGMIAYYEPIIFPPSPHREIRSGTFQVRLAPIIDPSTSIGKAYDESDPDNDLNLQFTRTYGWTVNDGEEWFLIEYPDGRLMWITVAAVIFDPQVDTDKDPSRQISDPLRLSPGRAYSNDVTNHDLLPILGVEVTA